MCFLDLAIKQGTMTPSEGSESHDDLEPDAEFDTFQQEFKLHKKHYYEEKFKIKVVIRTLPI